MSCQGSYISCPTIKSTPSREYNQLQCNPKTIIEPLHRPVFINAGKLKAKFGCELCQDVLYKPQTTICGARVCLDCISPQFGSNKIIKCPSRHTGITKEDLRKEHCQNGGLKKTHVVTDVKINDNFLKEPCQCENYRFGCRANPTWDSLNKHEAICQYVPQTCTNSGCQQKVSKLLLRKHIVEDCKFTTVDCEICHRMIKRQDLQDHKRKCKVNTTCSSCNQTLRNAEEYDKHIRTNISCINQAGKCFYYDKCGFSTNQIYAMRNHIGSARDIHSSPIAQNSTSAPKIMFALQDGGCRQPSSPGHQDKLKALQGHKNTFIKYENELRELEMRARNTSNVTYEGRMLWKITGYSDKKSTAARDDNSRAIYSRVFYSSPKGYKMRCRVYLNGDGPGKDQFLSVYFILMKGEFDGYLEFPFRQKITFRLICPFDEMRSKKETLQLSASDKAARRPVTVENLAAGIPLFASHKEIEEKFLANDSIFLDIRVE